MTDQPDTTKIRAGSEAWPRDIAWHRHTLVVLCDALDSAAAELAEVREERNWLSRGDLNNTMSAYRAHREVDDAVRRRAEAAEARIAAALDVAGHDFYQSEAQRLARDVRRALTEGPGP